MKIERDELKMNEPTVYTLTCTTYDDNEYSITLISKDLLNVYVRTLRRAVDLVKLLVVDDFTGEVHYHYERKVVQWDDGTIE